jgi:hypothetical protein
MIFGFTTSLPNWYRPDGPKEPSDIAEEAGEFVLAAVGTTHIEGMHTP